MDILWSLCINKYSRNFERAFYAYQCVLEKIGVHRLLSVNDSLSQKIIIRAQTMASQVERDRM
jgi:hypothetical protein